MAYTWHQVTEKEKEEIKTGAKRLLDEFSSKLSKIKTSEPKPEANEPYWNYLKQLGVEFVEEG